MPLPMVPLEGQWDLRRLLSLRLTEDLVAHLLLPRNLTRMARGALKNQEIRHRGVARILS